MEDEIQPSRGARRTPHALAAASRAGVHLQFACGALGAHDVPRRALRIPGRRDAHCPLRRIRNFGAQLQSAEVSGVHSVAARSPATRCRIDALLYCVRADAAAVAAAAVVLLVRNALR